MFSLAFLMIRDESDREFVENLYIKYEQTMYKIAYNILHKKTEAEDVVHNTFVKIIDNLEKIRRLDSMGTEFYLSTVTKHASLDEQRKTNRLPECNVMEELSEFKSDISVEDIVMTKLDSDRVKTALKSLSKDEFELLSMNLIMGYQPSEIAEKYGISSNTARQKIFRAKQHLKQELEKDEVNQ